MRDGAPEVEKENITLVKPEADRQDTDKIHQPGNVHTTRGDETMDAEQKTEIRTTLALIALFLSATIGPFICHTIQ